MTAPMGSAPRPQSPPLKEEVRNFWEAEACGERYGSEQERLRYELEPEILSFADFASGAGKRVLEIGVGMGADLVRWARAGASVTGVDLTERAASISRGRLQQEGLPGVVQVADAEKLPFPDGSFDIVYSWGVLHHSPDTRRAISEAQRVLAPGGRLKLMLYHRRSWVAVAAWARFCLLKGRPISSLSTAVAQVESPGTKAFSAGEVRAMLAGLTDLDLRPHLTHWDRRCAPGIASVVGDRFGWFLLIEAVKPQA